MSTNGTNGPGPCPLDPPPVDALDPPIPTVERATHYADRVSAAFRLLYRAHAAVVFDTPEDAEAQSRVLAEVRELMGIEEVPAS